MEFDANAYGSDVAAILALDGAGERLMPLVQTPCSSEKAMARLKASPARTLFPQSRAPEAALAGLYLYFSCWQQAHEVAQDVDSQEGSYWHGIVHRQEPDAGNAGYWFRQVGTHPIFPALAQRAAAIGVGKGGRWDPFAFIDFCEAARREPGSDRERQALEVQRAEWQLLFAYCAGG
jgi:hypothetical protein